MKKFTLEIELGNVAMQEREHIAKALRAVAVAIDDPQVPTRGCVRDVNGNKVGTWKIV